MRRLNLSPLQTSQSLSLFFLLICTLLLSPTQHATAAELAGISFPAQQTFQEKSFTLNGLGLREATIFKVDVYVAALYLEGAEKSNSATEILGSTREKVLQLSFLRDVEVEKIREAWKVGFERNGSKLSEIQPQIASFQKAMRSMQEGENMQMHFSENGVALRIQNQDTILFPGANFSRAVLAIWLGPNPPNEDLKLGILGK